MRKKKLNWWQSSGSVAAATTTTAVQDRFSSNLVLSLDTSLLGMMWVEDNATGPAITPVAANGDLVGMIQDVSPNAHTVFASASTVRPALGGDGTVISYITCDGTSDVLIVNNSKTSFRNFVGTTPAFSIMLKFKKGASTDGTLQGIISCNGATGGKTGFHIGISTGNKLTFTLTTNGTPNVTMVSKTTTANYLEADGWISVVIDVNSSGCSIYKNDGSAETATFTAGYNQDFSDNVTFFKNSSDTSSRFKGDFAQCIMLNRISTSGDRTWFQTFNPSRTTTLKPVNKESHYDFSDTTKTWQDTSKSVAATANNDLIKLIENLVTPNSGGALNRDATAPSDAKRPVLKTNVQNSKSCAQYDGDVTFQELNFTTWYRGGVWTFYLVLRNRNTTEGRKFLSDGAPNATTGTNYVTQTCEDDASNTPPLANFGTVAGDPYLISHPGGQAFGIKSSGRNDTINIYVVTLDGKTAQIYNYEKEVRTETNITGGWGYTKMGGIAGTWTQGDWYELIRYSGKKSASQISTDIDELKTKWGVS